MIDSGASLIEGSIKKDLVLASETGSLRRLLEASGLAFRVLSLNLEESTPNQALLRRFTQCSPVGSSSSFLRQLTSVIALTSTSANRSARSSSSAADQLSPMKRAGLNCLAQTSFWVMASATARGTAEGVSLGVPGSRPVRSRTGR
jgi:hypothetical protein